MLWLHSCCMMCMFRQHICNYSTVTYEHAMTAHVWLVCHVIQHAKQSRQHVKQIEECYSTCLACLYALQHAKQSRQPSSSSTVTFCCIMCMFRQHICSYSTVAYEHAMTAHVCYVIQHAKQSRQHAKQREECHSTCLACLSCPSSQGSQAAQALSHMSMQ